MGEADFQGADPAAMGGLAADIASAVDVLGAFQEAVESILGALEGGCWVGPDADAFGAALDTWRRRVHDTAAALDARGTELRDHGEEQEVASAAGTSADDGALAGLRAGSGRVPADDGARRASSGPAGPAGPAGPNMMIATPEMIETLDRLLREHVPGYSRLPEMPRPDRSHETPAERLLRLSRM